MTSYKYGNLFNLNSSTVNIHDLNKFNNVRKQKINFSDLTPQLQILGNVNPNNRESYVENGIDTPEESYMKDVLKGSASLGTFDVPTNDVLYMMNKNQNERQIDIMFDGSALIGQFPRINFIQFRISNIQTDSTSTSSSQDEEFIIESIDSDSLLPDWDAELEDNVITFTSSGVLTTTELIKLCTIKHVQPSENWNRLIKITALVVKSHLLKHVVLTNKIFFVPPLTGGSVYSFSALNYLSSKNYINNIVRIKPVNHSQQDNMFIIFNVENVVPIPGDVVFVVDNHLFGRVDKSGLSNYLCGWFDFTEHNIDSIKYIAAYMDYNTEYGNSVGNVEYTYKYYSSTDNTIYDLDSIGISGYKSMGYGSVANPAVLTKSNMSVIVDEIDSQNIYDLLVAYL